MADAPALAGQRWSMLRSEVKASFGEVLRQAVERRKEFLSKRGQSIRDAQFNVDSQFGLCSRWGSEVVEDAWHGRGVGQALMRACVDEARRAQYQTIWLGVWEHNGRAQSFYRKWSFHVVGDHIFQVGSDPQTDLIMERAL